MSEVTGQRDLNPGHLTPEPVFLMIIESLVFLSGLSSKNIIKAEKFCVRFKYSLYHLSRM